MANVTRICLGRYVIMQRDKKYHYFHFSTKINGALVSEQEHLMKSRAIFSQVFLLIGKKACSLF